MLMVELDKNSMEPVYIQIVQQIKYAVLYAKVHAHELLPSVRKLAEQLQINPNTVQKAYAKLEREGIVYKKAGKGVYVQDNMEEIKQMKHDEVVRKIKQVAKEARSTGMWIDEIFQLVDDVYSGK